MSSPVRTCLAACAVFLVAVTSVGAEAPERVEGVKNYKRLSAGLAAAGTPSAEAIARLKALGFQTVIDLRTAAEGTAEEKVAVESQGLRYVSVPMIAASVTLDDVRAVAAVLDDPAAGSVLLHCSGSVRVGGVLGVIQALKGKSLVEADATAREAGLKDGPMVDAMRRLALEAGAR
jgi:uncharacterized protein (TIGR01244 family)